MLRKLVPNIAAMWDRMDAGERMVAPVLFILSFVVGASIIRMVLLEFGLGR